MAHFPSLPADIHERLAARGIDPEHSVKSWLHTILDGSFPISAAGLPVGPREAYARRGARYTPTPIPLAVVLPAVDTP